MRKTKVYNRQQRYITIFLFLVLLGGLSFIVLSAFHDNESQSNEIFEDQLAVMVIDTNNQNIDDVPEKITENINGEIVELPQKSKRYKANMALYYENPFDASHRLDQVVETDIIINTRGQSSLTYPKKQYTVRLIDENEFENPQELLSMPKHDKWVLNGMYSDKSLIRNYLAYKMGRQSMEYAPRTRYVEVYLKTDEADTREDSYHGIYLLTEKIERNQNRIPIKNNEAKYRDSSFIAARDKIKSGDDVFETDWNKLEEEYSGSNENKKIRTVYTILDPNNENLTTDDKNNIQESINDFEYALYSGQFKDLRKGYQNYIDVDSFVKYIMINEITKNIDGGEVSAFFYKDISQKIKAGPVWDFDRSMGNTPSKEVNDPKGFLMVDRIWYERLFQDEKFVKRHKKTYRDYRRTIWSDENINYMIDEVILEITPSAIKDHNKWFNEESNQLFNNEIEKVRDFLITRLQWMDENIDQVKRITENVIE